MRKAVVVGIVVALGVAGLWLAVPARASFHEIRITEIFPGTTSEPFAQYVELQMYSPNQTQTQGQHLIFYDRVGTEVADKTVTRNMANGANQSHILFATPEAETVFGVQGDVPLGGDEIELEGGRVCWGTVSVPIDCASWGNYFAEDGTGAAKTGTPFNASGGLMLDQAMARKTSGGTDPSELDAGDDTNDSAADFQFASPTPQSNGSPVQPSSSPTASAPPVVQHDRVVTLTLAGKLVASGRVEVEDEFNDCLADVPVAVQKKNGRKFKTVKSTRTDAEGLYSVKVPNKPGTYRSKAKKLVVTSTDTCVGVNSKQVHH